jgi:hypothetical protein
MYIRMTGGRDRGEVQDFSFDDAQAMLRSGQAVPVDFNEPDPLGKRAEVEEIRSQIPVISSQSSQKHREEPAVMDSKNVSPQSGQKTRRKS